MSVELKVVGADGADAVKELFLFLSNLHLNLQNAVSARAAEMPAAPSAPVVVEATVEEAAPKKTAKKAAKEEKVVPISTSKATLQQAIDRAKTIAGDGKDAEIMDKLVSINTRLGIGKVRELPPEKLDSYMEELDKEFPAKAAGNMFD